MGRRGSKRERERHRETDRQRHREKGGVEEEKEGTEEEVIAMVRWVVYNVFPVNRSIIDILHNTYTFKFKLKK